MKCYVCKNYPKFTCKYFPSLFICNEHMDKHLSEPENHIFQTLQTVDILTMLKKDLKQIKLQIKANYNQTINKLLAELNNTDNEINEFIENLKKFSDTKSLSENELFKMVCELKSLKFFNSAGEEFKNKYFYKELQEVDGIYKGIIGLGPKDTYIKHGTGNKYYRDGTLFEGEWNDDKREGKGIFKYPNGNTYECEFKDDKPATKRVYKLAD